AARGEVAAASTARVAGRTDGRLRITAALPTTNAAATAATCRRFRPDRTPAAGTTAGSALAVSSAVAADALSATHDGSDIGPAESVGAVVAADALSATHDSSDIGPAESVGAVVAADAVSAT